MSRSNLVQVQSLRSDVNLYEPAKARTHEKPNQKHKKSKSTDSGDSASVIRPRRHSFYENTRKHIPKSPSQNSESPNGNLRMFLEHTTPNVPAQFIPEGSKRDGLLCHAPPQLDYALVDLWESLMEWSVYGAGVPLTLEDTSPVVQYYVPYLSGIQLYHKPSKSSNDESFHQCEKNGSSSDDSTDWYTLCQPLFEFFEQDRPHFRKPFTEKIMDLADKNSSLNTLRSCDLLPISWMCVAWYPIYQIPSGRTLNNDLDASFLTYHILSSPSKGKGNSLQCSKTMNIKNMVMDGIPRLSLDPFGMVSYKMKGATWMHNGMGELKLVKYLAQAAENWLRFLKVDHPDFQFFASRRAENRWCNW